eukprot:TRINITY_DN12794_c1_g1_i1.p1 TRINITY_DN12794_c1_g1~~TRINITY_DN12794_c1_g1_i1.p1  ORF type:complete len:391 (+),score=53.32 TRINITY_DN12794_c1_g1_i1:62-1174(+)
MAFGLWAMFGATLLRSSAGDLEARRQRCMRDEHEVPARKAFDLNNTFLPLLEGTAFAELEPRVLSTDPWIVYFDKFMDEEEVASVESHIFAQSFQASPAGRGGNQFNHRHSETAFCADKCDEHPTLQSVRKRASDVTRVPSNNFDFSQALRYKVGMYYKSHHDNHPTFHFLPSGSRIFTWFVYLSDKDLEGGGTRFPEVGVTASAKRGAAVLFVNTMDRNPMETDPRTMHESLEVTKGEKRGMNMWLYQYDFRRYWRIGCNEIGFADDLGKYGKSTSPIQLKVTIDNGTPRAAIHIFLAARNRAYARNSPGRYLGSAPPGQSLTFDGIEGDVFLIRNARMDGDLLKEYSVNGTQEQTVRIGAEESTAQEL